MPATTPQKQAVPTFNQATRQAIIPAGTFNYVVGSPQQQQLPQVGLLANLWLTVSATFLTAHTGTYTIVDGPIPNPYGIIQRVRVFTNEGNELINLSAAGLYLIQRLQRSSYDPRNPLASLGSTNTAAAIYNAPTMAIDTTYTITFNMKIPIAWGPQLQAGLILLQNNYTRITAEVTFNDGTVSGNLITMGGTTPSISALAVTCLLAMEIFNLPPSTASYPDLSKVLIQREDLQPVTNTGNFSYNPVLGNTYLDWIMQFENNGARMVPANFSQLQLVYSQTQAVYNETPSQFLARNRELLGNIDLPDGVFWWAMSDGFGLLEVGNTRDAINTGLLTALQLISTIGSTVTLTNARVRVISRQLASVA